MVEIRVEQKTARSVWMWIIGLIVLALVIWALVELFTDDAITPAVEPLDPARTIPAPTGAGIPHHLHLVAGAGDLRMIARA